jgi:cytochrome c oxidase cbb3-type subunit 3
MQEIASKDFNTILGDSRMLEFSHAVGKTLFIDNCAACHGMGGAGVVGLFPNLVDDAWLWGGKIKQIYTTLENGRHGFMPAFRNSLNQQQLNDVVEYVLSLSIEGTEPASAARGKAIFTGETGGCYYCHTKQATGLVEMGAANLSDSIWTIADVPGADTLDQKRAAIRKVVSGGVNRKMPAWSDRLTEAEIKVLAVYVHELGGGQ